MAGSPIVVLDIGASRTLCLVGESQRGEELRVLGLGDSPCTGLRRSAVIDMPRLVESIRQAVAAAERAAGVKITGAYAGVAGEDVVAHTNRSTIAISGVSKPIDEEDMARAVAAAEQSAPSEGAVILHRFVQSYAVDGEPVLNPLWLHGNRLETETLSIAASAHTCTTLQRAAAEAGLEIVGFILEAVAAAAAVVTQDEREMGVGILDLGAGTSDLAIFCGNLRHVVEIPLGSADITRDLSVVLQVTPRTAEQLKRECGCVRCADGDADETITFRTTAGRTRTLTRYQLSEIIEARQHEILEFVRQELERTPYSQMLGAGLVLTGGGALLANLPQLGEEVLGKAVRLGVPQNLIGPDALQDPQYATVAGLLRFAAEEHPEEALPVAAAGGERLLDRLTRLLSFF